MNKGDIFGIALFVIAFIILALASEKPHNIHVWDESEQ
jgi:hypothetical protein